MKLRIGCLVLVCGILLAGCSKAVGPPPSSGEESSSVPISSSSLPGSSSQPWGTGLYAHEAEIPPLVNGVLADYAAGKLPNPVVYHTEAHGLLAWPPYRHPMPAAVESSRISYELGFDEMYGTDSLTVRTDIGDDYEMVLYLLTDGEKGQGKISQILGVNFEDKRGVVNLPELKAPGGAIFRNIVNSRVYSAAEFEGFAAEGLELNGSLQWQKGGMLWLHLYVGSSYFMYTYLIDDDGAFTQDYPTDEYREINNSPYGDEEMQKAAVFLLEQFSQGLEDAGQVALPV